MIRFETDNGVAFIDPRAVVGVEDTTYDRAIIHLPGSTLVVIGTAHGVGTEIAEALKEGISWFD
jgi:hypothetical protein